MGKTASPGDFAVMYRTNAQSRLLEEAFLRAGLPYKLVGAPRFYGRREVKDVIAYLRQYSDSPSDLPEADATATATDHDLAPEILALEGDAEYGEYLSSECTTCHQIDGADAGIRSIVFWPEPDFVVAMHAYKNKRREHPVMNMIAGRLNEEEIAALAAYFSNLEN